jgi:hypothetical protein
MKTLLIQIQLSPQNKAVSRLLEELLKIPGTREMKITKGPPRQKYINIAIRTRTVRQIWLCLSDYIRTERMLSRHSIVVSEGRHGWEDYELLFHWKSEKMDKKWK